MRRVSRRSLTGWALLFFPIHCLAVEVVVHTNRTIHPRFQGPGFHVFSHLHPHSEEEFEQILGKRWVELEPAFARVTHWWDSVDPVRAKPESRGKLVQWLRFFAQRTGTLVYLTTWNPPVLQRPEDRDKYARVVAEELEFLLHAGATNLRYYCMTNELTFGQWGAWLKDLPDFADFHRRIHRALRARRVSVGLLATDASPIQHWPTLEWAARHMSRFTAVYGAHHYFNEHELEDLNFYEWFYRWCRWAVQIARSQGKEFLIGEFGARQDGRVRNGKHWDACIYWDTPKEPLVGIQLAEAVLAAMNAGVWAMAYWTFTDFPDAYSDRYANKWGVFRWADDGWRPRAVYYAYGLLTKFFHGPGVVYTVSVSQPMVRAAAMRRGQASWTVAVVNRSSRAEDLVLRFRGIPYQGRFRKYVYDPERVPMTEDGDLHSWSALVPMQDGQLIDTLPAGALVIYTTMYDEEPPLPPTNVRARALEDGVWEIHWEASPSGDVSYYRVYRDGLRVGSSITTRFVDRSAKGRAGVYRVAAVDRSGNTSP